MGLRRDEMTKTGTHILLRMRRADGRKDARERHYIIDSAHFNE